MVNFGWGSKSGVVIGQSRVCCKKMIPDVPKNSNSSCDGVFAGNLETLFFHKHFQGATSRNVQIIIKAIRTCCFQCLLYNFLCCTLII